jgi:hypothetical protein
MGLGRAGGVPGSRAGSPGRSSPQGARCHAGFCREETGSDDLTGRLVGARLIACAQRDEVLASVIAFAVVGMAHRVYSGSETIDILQALLSAGAAFQREDAWVEWLERQLAYMARRLPAGEPSKTPFIHLQVLKKVLKLTLGIHVRAEALASAAN